MSNTTLHDDRIEAQLDQPDGNVVTITQPLPFDDEYYYTLTIADDHGNEMTFKVAVNDIRHMYNFLNRLECT